MTQTLKIVKKDMKNKYMTTTEIYTNIKENGGFNNYRRWTTKEIEEWIINNFPCTRYTAKEVARLIR